MTNTIINSHCVLFTELQGSAIEIVGSSFNRSNLEKPDPAFYWSLNKTCKNYRGNGMKLLIFDTGIMQDPHPSFASLIEDEKLNMCGLDNCNDLDGHGTFCAGIACGSLQEYDEDGVSVRCCGVAPNANLVIWKGYKYADKIPIEPWLQQLEVMASNCDGVDVVVISSGFEQPNKRMKDAIIKLDSKGVIVVCAAGNDGAENLENIRYPALYPPTISVGASNRKGHACGFSSVGKKIDVLALGEDIVGPKNHVDTKLEDSNIRKYCRRSGGTSFAAPAVGALICLILQAVKETCAKEHYDRLKNNDSMKILLQKLVGQEGAISSKQLEKFFNKDSSIYLGPNHFISEMITSNAM